ncbi:MAG: hypothetical protein Q8Q06_03440 [bacterium]|nr:hypothetical protein [bacterium]
MKKDSTAGSVEVFPDLCVSRESVVLLEGFIPYIKPFAERLELNIKIDWPAKKIKEFDTHNNVFIHFDTCPENVSAKINESPNFIFGQRMPGNVVIEEAGVSSAGISVTSPEGDRIACISKGNIFIFPKILRDGCTSKETANILEQILYWSLGYSANLLFDRTKNSKLQVAYKRLRRYIVFKTIRSERVDRISSGIKLFLDKEGYKRYNLITDSLGDAVSSREKYRQKHFKMLLEISELEDSLEWLEEKCRERDFGGIFDEILTWAHVQTIRVTERKGKKCIEIRTEELNKQVGNSTYCIGKFEIFIDPSIKSTVGIHFHQGRDRGSFYHGHTQEESTCFGIESVAHDKGLKNDMDKLMLNLDLLPLVNLIFTFLQKEITPPNLWSLLGNSLIKDPGPEKNIDDKYENDEEREEEKKKFIELLSETVIGRNSEDIRRKITGSYGFLKKINNRRNEARMRIKSFGTSKEYLEDKFSDTAGTAAKECRLLVDRADVYNVEANESEMLIYFTHEFKENTACGNIFGYILKVCGDFAPVLFFNSENKILEKVIVDGETVKGLKVIPSNFKNHEEIIAEIARLNRHFNFSRLLSLAGELIECGICDKRDKTQGGNTHEYY